MAIVTFVSELLNGLSSIEAVLSALEDRQSTASNPGH